MSLETRLTALVQSIGADIKALRAQAWSQQVLSTTYVNATTTGTDVNVGFVPVANKRYEVRALLSVASISTTNAIQVALLGPVSGAGRVPVRVLTASTVNTDRPDHMSALNTYSTQTVGIVTPTLVKLEAIVEMGATPGAGNVRLGARARTAATNAIQIFPGSFMSWRELV